MTNTSSEEIFLGRDSEMSALDRVITAWRNPSNVLPQVALIWGQGGIGKSTLLRHFSETLKGPTFSTAAILKIDWQMERDNNAPFQVVKENVKPIAVLDKIDHQASSYFDTANHAYSNAKKQLSEAELQLRKAIEAFKLDDRPQSSTGVAGVMSEIVGAGATMSAIAHGNDPESSKAAGDVMKAGLRFLIERFSWSTPSDLDRGLKSVDGTTRELLEQPDSYLAQSLAKDLVERSVSRPLIIVFDTYEIVSEVDPMMRTIIKLAGPRVAWIIAGRDDLYAERMGTFGQRLGYGAEDRQSYRVERIDLRQLAQQELAEYFRLEAPNREAPAGDELTRLYQATRGIPLAIRIACNIWRTGASIEAVAGADGRSDPELVQEMVERYLKHCALDGADRRALAAVAMADGNADVLRAMIEPELKNGKTYEARLAQLGDRHAAVQRRAEHGIMLHDDAKLFFLHRLLGDWRGEEWVRTFAEHAADVFRDKVKDALNYHISLDGLCEDKDYNDSSSNLVRYLFWIDADEAARLLTMFVMEGLAHSSEFVKAVLDVATPWRAVCDDRLAKRLGVLRRGSYAWSDGRIALVQLLEDDYQRGWIGRGIDTLEHAHAREHKAIYHWLKAGALRRQNRFGDALDHCTHAAKLVPEKGAVREHVIERAREIGYSCHDARDYRRMLSAYQLAWRLDKVNAVNWRNVGASYSWLGKHEEALKHHLKALELDSDDADNWREVGKAYSWLGKHEEALKHHLKVLELDSDDADNWRSVGIVYSWLRKPHEALEHLLKALEFDSNNGDTWLEMGFLLAYMGKHEEALEHALKAVELGNTKVDNWSRLATIHLMSRRYTEAEAALARTSAIDASDAYSLSVRTRLSLYGGDSEVPDVLSDEVISKHPRCLQAKAYLLGSRGSWKEAAQMFKRSTEVDPHDPTTWTGLWGACRLAEPGFNADVSLETRARELVKQQNQPDARAWLAALDIRAGNLDAALDALEAAIKHTPWFADEARFRPECVPFREHPRFRELTKPLG
jgi:tetratricopeptide (TPR) repeat protein